MTRPIYHRESRRKISSSTEICNDESSSGLGYGLLVTLQNNIFELSFCADVCYSNVHPNAYAMDLSNVEALGGGGSGVTAFAGHHPKLGDLVMKHGGHNDLQQLFALATIAKELHKREDLNKEAAEELKQSIPEFGCIYISPFHLGEKRRDLFQRLKHLYSHASSSSSSQVLLPKPLHDNSIVTKHPNNVSKDCPQLNLLPIAKRVHCSRCVEQSGTSSSSTATARHRHISVYASINQVQASVKLVGNSLNLVIPDRKSKISFQTDGLSSCKRRIRLQEDGYTILKALVDDLVPLMKEQQWKVTLGQKRIGGTNPRTGSSWLYSGKLEGKLLDNLVSQKIRIVRDLASLTNPEELDIKTLKNVTEEITIHEESSDLSELPLTEEADSWVGNSIKKNFEKDTGRFPVLMLLGKQFREYYEQHSSHHHENNAPGCICSEGSCSMVLTPDEEIPAHHLGNLTRPGALMADTFANVPAEPCVLDTMHPHYWRNLLKLAVQPRLKSCMDKTSTTALTRIWTCGLTDAGLHNLFLTEDSLELFDLGQPTLNSTPGFLTKFLFSFFHTIGMEEVPGSKGAEWINCFVPDEENGKLRITKETEQKLAHAYKAFEKTLDRLIEELFDGDDSLRWLLLQFVTLQLHSDASFCLQKWTVKVSNSYIYIVYCLRK